MKDKQPVKSSTIQAYSYDVSDKVLKVWFKTGAVYSYQNVTPDVMSSVFDGPGSKGRLFATRIANKYEGSKIQE